MLVRDRFRGKRVLDVIIDIPFALPTIVAGLVLLSLYGPNSPLGLALGVNTEHAVSLALAFVTLPFVVRTVQPVLEELEADVEEAAASLGASRLTIFRRIILPSLAPAIAAGAALSFARAISEYGSLVLLSRQPAVRDRGGLGPGALLHRERQHRRGGRARLGDARGRAGRHRRARHRPEAGGPPWLRSRTPTRWPLRLLAVGYVFFLVAWPVALVVQQTFADGLATLSDALADPQVTYALRLTAMVATWAVVINLVFGVGISMLLVRYEFPGKRVLSALIDVPLSVSPVVVGLALLLVYNGRDGWFGKPAEEAGLADHLRHARR